MAFLKELGHLRIPLKDIQKATNNFGDKNVIGEGGYGMVYEGNLLYSKGLSRVAAKRVNRYFSPAQNEFFNEMRVLSSYKHVNIVSLIGFCDEYDEDNGHHEKIVVQEFMTNGSLDKYVRSAKLTWLKRLQICLGAAHGLNYLHNGLKDHSVIHCDVRSRTILLDENWQARIGGFGLSMMDPVHPNTFVSGSIGIGAPGYVDPIFLQTGVVTNESDVYSFGIVLFEVLCGRLAYETFEEDNKQLLGPFARLHYEEGKLNEIIDPILREQIDQDSLEAFSSIAYQCLKKNRSERPTMIHIVQKLEQVLGLQQEFEKALALQQVAVDLKGKEDEGNSYKVKNLEHMKIPLKQIESATNHFHDDFLIGHGGYGKVYKAKLFHFDVQKYVKESLIQGVHVTELLGYQRRQSMVAVKRLDRTYGQGTSEFLQEISVLTNFRHKNLITLVGFCDEVSERILVYEFASNKSLDRYISSTKSTNNLTWSLRLQICLDASRGLEFLHNGVGEHYRIIHRDIKSSNILLGENLVGKISDFGLSRIGPANLQASFVMTQVAGTLEYVDPQYHKTGVLTKGSDVYSFGVVLFEVLSGRLAYFQRSKDDNEFLPHMAKRCFEQKKLNMIIDPKLKNEFGKGFFTSNDETIPDSISIFAAIAYKCLQESRDDRPTMSDVVEELEKALKSQVKGVEALRISFDAINKATNNFNDEMKHEAYGMVYKGELSHSKGRDVVIVKRLDRIMDTYENEFNKEIAKLYSHSHMNVIPILGFCEEKNDRFVIFKHMVNGSVKEHIKNASLTWKQRIKISIEAARGLAYIHAQHLTHGDMKSSNILLNHDWKVVISNFIISKGLGTLGYYDPLYDVTGITTQKSDVYAFGVVLFEILSGRLATEMLKMDQQGLHEGEDGQVKIFPDIKGQINKKSLLSFSTIAYLCLQEQPRDRPTMSEVVKELEISLECQDEWEWEQKLPTDYMEIIHMSKYPVSITSTKKDLYSLLSSGILLDNGKLWFSINMDGVKNEMISATKFSFKNVKWRSIRKSRFSKVAKISDISNLNIQVQIKRQLLTPEIMYGAYLVFKFCDRKKFSSRPLYVNLKYQKAGESLNAYFAEWRAGSKWLTVELFRFWNNKETVDFNVLLESFSHYYCGNGGVFIEGIEFNTIQSFMQLENKENIILNAETIVQRRLRPELEIEWAQQMAIDYNKIINRSEISFQNISKEELYFVLYKGIVIDKGDKIFSISKVNKKKCHMLPAKAVIYDPPNAISYNLKAQPPSRYRFAEFVEILPRHEFRIKCDIDKQLLSSDTVYACFLVFKLSERCRGLKCPVKARDLLPYKKERTKIISLTSPSMINLEKIKWIPEQREDGWMEVKIWETISDRYNDESIPMDMKLISFEGNMFGLNVYGIEFRPT